jgi:hypothetical protein
MNLPVSVINTDVTQTKQLNFHFLLEERADGQIVGTIAEFPDCRVAATTSESAIDELHEILRDRTAKMTVVPFTLPINLQASEEEHPWEEFIGMYEGDPIFAEIAAELRAERGLEHLGWIE